MDNENQNYEQEPNRFDAPPIQENQEAPAQGNYVELNSNPTPTQGEYRGDSTVPNNYQQNYQNMGTTPNYYQAPYMAPKPEKKHFGLALTSLILGILSLMCCWLYGLSLVPALIGSIFGLIAVIKGRGTSVRVMAAIGLALGIISLMLNVWMIISYAVCIDWSMITQENLESIKNVNPESEEEMMQWIQQFFKIDITSSMY